MKDISIPGDELYIRAERFRELATALTNAATILESKAINLWAQSEKDPSTCLSTDSSASSSA